ncbi:2'-5' RNA ligase family protein [Amycolatopsis sp. NPDC058986]|uniref:2'-5' RNA ligase family protein n=1 Tax=unclassified Amycolatopsis TaxID=2618356 RepID=UPI00366B70BE
MREFFNPARRWPAEQTRLHVYHQPDVDALAPLLKIYCPILADAGFLAVVPDRWLHLTIAQITTPTADIDPAARAQLAAALRERLGELEPIRVTVGPALVGDTSLVLDVTPDHDVTALAAAAVEVIDTVLGPGTADLAANERPHITLAYGTGTGDSGPLGGRLRRATGTRTELLVDLVDLVDVVQDPPCYRWHNISALPLAPTRQPRS